MKKSDEHILHCGSAIRSTMTRQKSTITCIYKLVKFCLFILKKLCKKHFMTSIKGRYSVENLGKMTLYNTNVDLSMIIPFVLIPWPAKPATLG